jgi:hypothetical protein
MRAAAHAGVPCGVDAGLDSGAVPVGAYPSSPSRARLVGEGRGLVSSRPRSSPSLTVREAASGRRSYTPTGGTGLMGRSISYR